MLVPASTRGPRRGLDRDKSPLFPYAESFVEESLMSLAD